MQRSKNANFHAGGVIGVKPQKSNHKIFWVYISQAAGSTSITKPFFVIYNVILGL